MSQPHLGIGFTKPVIYAKLKCHNGHRNLIQPLCNGEIVTIVVQKEIGIQIGYRVGALEKSLNCNKDNTNVYLPDSVI